MQSAAAAAEASATMAEEEEYNSTLHQNEHDEDADDEAVQEAALKKAAAVNLARNRMCWRVRDGDALGVQQAILNGTDVNCVHEYFNMDTPLMHACDNRFTEIVRILLDAGADARWKNSDGRSAMYSACNVMVDHLPNNRNVAQS